MQPLCPGIEKEDKTEGFPSVDLPTHLYIKATLTLPTPFSSKTTIIPALQELKKSQTGSGQKSVQPQALFPTEDSRRFSGKGTKDRVVGSDPSAFPAPAAILRPLVFHSHSSVQLLCVLAGVSSVLFSEWSHAFPSGPTHPSLVKTPILLCSLKEGTKDRVEVCLSVSLHPMQVLDLLWEAGWVPCHSTTFTFGYGLRLLPWPALLDSLGGVT